MGEPDRRGRIVEWRIGLGGALLYFDLWRSVRGQKSICTGLFTYRNDSPCDSGLEKFFPRTGLFHDRGGTVEKVWGKVSSKVSSKVSCKKSKV